LNDERFEGTRAVSAKSRTTAVHPWTLRISRMVALLGRDPSRTLPNMAGTAASHDLAVLMVADWAALPEDEPGELVDGRLEEEEVPDLQHEILVAWLVRTLGNWLAPRRGFVFGSEAKLAISPTRGRKPDVSVYLPGRPPLPARGAVPIPPDVAIEVVSPTPRDGRRDRVEKMADYAAFGVRYYWIIEPELRTLEIYERGSDGRYIYTLGATTGIIEDVAGCAGLVLDLDSMWEEIDRLEVENTDSGG
jgi:Uma2 family endonuclease